MSDLTEKQDDISLKYYVYCLSDAQAKYVNKNGGFLIVKERLINEFKQIVHGNFKEGVFKNANT